MRTIPLTPDESAAIDAFHRAYYDAWEKGQGSLDLSWFGYRAIKSPLDLWIYQEIIVALRPDVIVECGTASGGSALFLASNFDLLGHGDVVTIEIAERPPMPRHPRITRLHGSSVDESILAEVRRRTAGKRVMVILDSDHSEAHVAAELRAYRDIVSVGSLLIVEDTNVNGHPVRPDYGPGPMEALDGFLAANPDYEVDSSYERLMLTMNPRGYLRRVSQPSPAVS
jgi:cephalosporin hydroxylase